MTQSSNPIVPAPCDIWTRPLKLNCDIRNTVFIITRIYKHYKQWFTTLYGHTPIHTHKVYTKSVCERDREVHTCTSERSKCLPGCHWYNLVSFQLQVSLAAGSIAWKNSIHDVKELLNALILPEVFSSFYKEWIFPFITASNYYTLWFPDWFHYFYLGQNRGKKEQFRLYKKIL